MPKYYFDVTDAGNLTRDEVGVELNDDDVARDQAIGLLPAIARETFPDGDRHEIVVTARNEAGRWSTTRTSPCMADGGRAEVSGLRFV